MTITFESVALREQEEGRILHLAVSGKLTTTDYELFVPEIERRIDEFGKVSLMVEFADFAGWSMGAAWEDTKFDAKHWNDIDRLAIVGDGKLEKGLAMFARPFTTAQVKFFPTNRRADALRWLHGAEAAAG
jgi:hypothetical protein